MTVAEAPEPEEEVEEERCLACGEESDDIEDDLCPDCRRALGAEN